MSSPKPPKVGHKVEALQTDETGVLEVISNKSLVQFFVYGYDGVGLRLCVPAEDGFENRAEEVCGAVVSLVPGRSETLCSNNSGLENSGYRNTRRTEGGNV